jgi:hypothetical protein
MANIGLSFPKVSEKSLEAICKNVRNRLFERNHLTFTEDNFSYTTTILFLNNLSEYLGNHPNETINVHDLLIYSVVNRPDDKGEKGGNIVPDIKVGARFQRIFENGFSEEDLTPYPMKNKEEVNFTPEPYPEECEDQLNRICEDVHQALIPAPYNTDVVLPSVVYTIVVAFLDELARVLGENKDSVIHLDTYHIFSTSEFEGKVLPHIECGETFKVNIKDDDVTENEDE